MNRELESASGRLDRVDVTDHVGDGHVRCRELFDETLVRREPCDGEVVAGLREPRPATAAERGEGVVVNLAAGYDRYLVVEQVDKCSEDACLCLPAQAQNDEIMLGQDGVHDLGDYRTRRTRRFRETAAPTIAAFRSGCRGARV